MRTTRATASTCWTAWTSCGWTTTTTDDPVLLRPDGSPVDTWREGYPYDERMSPRGVRADQAAAADRAAQAAVLGQGHRAEARHPVRGPRRRRQGRHDQAVHGAPQPARRAGRRAGEAERARVDAVVLPALRRPPAGRRRDRAVRPVLVQPGRRRAGDGLLHREEYMEFMRAGARVRADAGPHRHPPGQAVVLGVPRRAAHPVPRSARSTRSGSGSSARPTWPRWTSGTTTPRPRRRCSSTPTPRTRRGR